MLYEIYKCETEGSPVYEGNNLVGYDDIKTHFFVNEVSLDPDAIPFDPADYRSAKLIAKNLDYNDLILLKRALGFITEKQAA